MMQMTAQTEAQMTFSKNLRSMFYLLTAILIGFGLFNLYITLTAFAGIPSLITWLFFLAVAIIYARYSYEEQWVFDRPTKTLHINRKRLAGTQVTTYPFADIEQVEMRQFHFDRNRAKVTYNVALKLRETQNEYLSLMSSYSETDANKFYAPLKAFLVEAGISTRKRGKAVK